MTYDTINDAVTMAGGAGALLAGRYRIVKQLGQGGMGSVWLAEDTQLDNKPFAIKMLPSILVSNKRAYAQLKKEALVAMTLSHTNIVTVRAFEENNGNPFLVMDYIDGETLDDHLAENGKLSEDETLRVLRPIAAALDYAHAKGVVHRDVKPGNVMIAKDGTPYILDFGIAREIQETMTRVTGKLSSGTLLYMSPEQLMGEPPKPAQDIYSFAVMAYECLKGEPPFSHGQIEFQIMNKQPDPPPGGTQLVASVMAGLAKKPEDRPATCAAVLEGNNLTQRRREAESQGGRARSPSGPHGNGFSRVEHVERVDGVGGARRPAEPVVRRVPTPPQSGGARSRATAQTTEGPRSRATVTGILAAVLIAVLAGGAWWFVNARTARSTGTTGVPPVATNAPTGTTGAPPVATNALTGTTGVPPVATNAPTGTTGVSPVVTDADVVAIAVEASVQKDRIARIDDADGFREKKDGVSGLLTRAAAYGKARRYRESAQAFSNYVEKCQELVRLDGERKSALKSKAQAQEAFQIAESADAKTYAGSSWNTAVGVWRQAFDQFGRMDFSQAGRTFSSAAKLFGKCADEVKTAKENEIATRIQEAESYLKSLQNSMADIEQVRATVATKTAPKNLPLLSRIRETYGVYNKACIEMDRLRTIYTDLNPKVVGQTDVVNTAFSDMQNVIAQALRSLTTIRQTPDELTALERDIFTFEFFKENLPRPLQDCLGDHYEAYCKAYTEKRVLRTCFTEEHPAVQAVAKRADAALAAFMGELRANKSAIAKARKEAKFKVRADMDVKASAKAKAKACVEERVNGRAETGLHSERIIAGHKGIQLWEGGPYWATTNIGAEKPEDYGYYFWWGDTVGYKRVGDSWVASDGSRSDFSFGRDTTSTWGESNDELMSGGWITMDGILAPEHDAAHVHWGGDWRMPTNQELDDLASKCDWTWTTLNGVKGYEVRGKGAYVSARIFLPAAGYGYGTSLNNAGSDGYYWSSVPGSGSNYSWSLNFDSSYHSADVSYRGRGQSVRPVQGFTK